MKVRGVIHAHDLQTHDGVVSLAELKKSLFAHGVSFCCLTAKTSSLTNVTAAAFVDECHQLSDQAFVFIPGFEVVYKDVPLLLVGTEVFLGTYVDEAVLRRWREVTPLIFLARSKVAIEGLDNFLLSLIDGIEVWNQQLDGASAPHFKSLKLYSQLRGFKPDLRAIGGIGSPESPSTFVPTLELEVDAVTMAEIVRQLGLGFYEVKSGRTRLASDGRLVMGGGLVARLLSLRERLVAFVSK